MLVIPDTNPPPNLSSFGDPSPSEARSESPSVAINGKPGSTLKVAWGSGWWRRDWRREAFKSTSTSFAQMYRSQWRMTIGLATPKAIEVEEQTQTCEIIFGDI